MPYIIFKVISAIIDLLFYSTVLLFKDRLFNILFFSGGWFILSLFFTSILFCAIESYTYQKLWIQSIIVIILFGFGLFSSYANLTNVSELTTQVLVGLLFYYIGYLANRFSVERIKELERPFKTGLMVCSFAVLFGCFVCQNDYMVLMYTYDYGNSLVFITKSVVCSISILIIGIIWSNCFIIEKIWELYLLIMVIHFSVYRSLRYITNMLIGSEHSGVLFDSICIILITFISYFVASIISKKFPIIGGHWSKKDYSEDKIKI